MSRVHIKTNLDNLLVLHRARRAVDVKLTDVSLDIEIRQTALKIVLGINVMTVDIRLS